eukprot:TRINITY_DN29457_c0_g1_i1.p1 TRINITY_DN29457_c0_g1~~TRINITY_DN29457_c0_g1_i1.p1  ORF type:complete len:560 (+),score=94.81 TRINITY_DN29457_c0_g1_i1:118-1797(+)
MRRLVPGPLGQQHAAWTAWRQRVVLPAVSPASACATCGGGHSVASTGGSSSRRFSYVAEPLPEAKGDPMPRRRSRFDLPEEPKPKLSLPEPGAADSTAAAEALSRARGLKLHDIQLEDVLEVWPPPALVNEVPDLQKEGRTVQRPLHWLVDPKTLDDAEAVRFQPEVGVDDVGRFVPASRDSLINLLPEGGCGELAKDLTLIPSRSVPTGLMMRKLTVELMMQLSQLRDASDKSGKKRIRKSGFLLDGHKGTGKSQVLNSLVMWARENGWLVVLEPNPSRYSREIAEIKRSNNGIYIQNEFAGQFLEATSIANRQMLEDIPVDKSVYGSRAIDGESITQTKRLYEPLIEKTVDEMAGTEELSPVARLQKIAQYRRQVRIPSMLEGLPDPANVWEIVDFGLSNHSYATQAVAELFVQLQRQVTHPVLVVVDEWNECFPCSQYVSIRYDNTRFHGYIPAFHLSMPRMFHRWDGHLYRRGLKICATSWAKMQRRDYKPGLLGVKDYEIRTVRNFTPMEFANYVMYLQASGVLYNFPAEDLEYVYMLTSGNGWHTRRFLSTLY